MAVINDQDVRRIRTTISRTSTSNGSRTSDSTPVIALAPGASVPSAPQRVTRLRPRPAAVEQLDQLPLAVGFGSAIDLTRCRLWAVPGLPADVIALPVELDHARHDAWMPSIVATADPGTVREPAPLSLTARGRAVLMLLAAAVGVVVVVFAWFGAASSTAPTRAAQPAQVTVHVGDTLWSIAGRVAPNHDPRAVVARLLQLNHLRTPTLIPGQVLLTR